MELRTARVFVDDLDEAMAFYMDRLGLPLAIDARQHGYVLLQPGPVQVVIESVPADAPPEDRALVGRFTGLSFTVADVAQTHRELLARGVRFTGEPERQAWGGVLATLADPAGNQWQIVQPPAA